MRKSVRIEKKFLEIQRLLDQVQENIKGIRAIENDDALLHLDHVVEVFMDEVDETMYEMLAPLQVDEDDAENRILELREQIRVIEQSMG